MEFTKAHHARNPRNVQLKVSNLASPQNPNMNPGATLGLEELGIQKKPGKYARRRVRKAAQQSDAIEFSPKEDNPKQEAWCPPAVPSYRALSIPPLGMPATTWAPALQAASSPSLNEVPSVNKVPSTFTKYIPVQGHMQGNTLQNLPRYEPVQGFIPINARPAPPNFYAQPQQVDCIYGPYSGIFGNKPSVAPVPQRASLHTQAPPSTTVLPVRRSQRAAAQPHIPQPSAPLLQHRSQLPLLPDGHSQPAAGQPQISQPSVWSQLPPLRPAEFLQRWASQKPSGKQSLIKLPAPKPTAAYMTLAQAAPGLLPSPQRLLLVLDLNGTLLYRPKASTSFTPRPCLQKFLAYAFANHTLMIWSSATPANVLGICKQFLTPEQRARLLAEWGRDTLGLTADQYQAHVQVYKRLNKVWENRSLQSEHPGRVGGAKWGQHNTLLIDDSVLKASAQPYNHIEIPEFVKGGGGEKKEGETTVLAQVVGYLEEARKWSDVSAFVRCRRFEVNQGWRWDFSTTTATKVTQGHAPSQAVLNDDDDSPMEEDGVKI